MAKATLLLFAILSASCMAQETATAIPSSVAERCDSIGTQKATGRDASAYLKQVTLAMDPTGAYAKKAIYSLSGGYTKSFSENAGALEIGTFEISENHSSPEINYTRKFTVNGKAIEITKQNGEVLRTPPASEGLISDAQKKMVSDKSYLFPLSVLYDETGNSHFKAYFVLPETSAPGRLSSLNKLIHIRTILYHSPQSGSDQIEDWYINPTTNMPLYVAHRTPSINHPGICVELVTGYESFQKMSGTTIPTKISTKNGTMLKTETIQALSY